MQLLLPPLQQDRSSLRATRLITAGEVQIVKRQKLSCTMDVQEPEIVDVKEAMDEAADLISSWTMLPFSVGEEPKTQLPVSAWLATQLSQHKAQCEWTSLAMNLLKNMQSNFIQQKKCSLSCVSFFRALFLSDIQQL